MLSHSDNQTSEEYAEEEEGTHPVNIATTCDMEATETIHQDKDEGKSSLSDEEISVALSEVFPFLANIMEEEREPTTAAETVPPLLQDSPPLLQEDSPSLPRDPPSPLVTPIPKRATKRTPKKKIPHNVYPEEKRPRGEDVVSDESSAIQNKLSFRYSLWTISVIRDEFGCNGISGVDDMNICIKIFALLTCSSYGDNPSPFLGTGYTVHTILSHLHQDRHENIDHVSLIGYIPKEEAFVTLIQNSLRMYDYLVNHKASVLASFAVQGSKTSDAEIAEDERLDAVGILRFQEREAVRAAQRKNLRMAARVDPDAPMSSEELAAEADIVAQEILLVRAEELAIQKDYDDFQDILPLPDTIRPMVDWAFQKRRGPKDLNLKDIISLSSVVKSIIVLETNHRLKLTNVRLIFSSVRKARFAKIQLHFAIHYIHPLYQKILFVCFLNKHAFLSYSHAKWIHLNTLLSHEIFTPKYDGRNYRCMKGEMSP